MCYNLVFIDMRYKKQLRIRITEDQFKRLIDRVILEESTPSIVVREVLDKNLKKNNKHKGIKN